MNQVIYREENGHLVVVAIVRADMARAFAATTRLHTDARVFQEPILRFMAKGHNAERAAMDYFRNLSGEQTSGI